MASCEALLDGDAAAGIEILDRLEERGRDPRALLDQVVDAVRARLVAEASTGDAAGLADVARRLVAIDPDRAGIGGLRLQLELALFAGPRAAAAGSRPSTSMPTARPEPAPATPVGVARPPIEEPTAAKTAQTDAAQAPANPQPAAPPAATETAAVKPEPPAPPAAMDTASARPEPEAAPTTPAVATGNDLEAAPTTPAVATGNDLERLVSGWAGIVRAVGPATRAVLTECRPIAVEGNVVTLGFPEAKSFLKDHAERKRPELEAAIGEHLGRPVNVRAVATNIEVAPLVGADDLVAEARRIFGDDLVDVAEVD